MHIKKLFSFTAQESVSKLTSLAVVCRWHVSLLFLFLQQYLFSADDELVVYLCLKLPILLSIVLLIHCTSYEIDCLNIEPLGWSFSFFSCAMSFTECLHSLVLVLLSVFPFPSLPLIFPSFLSLQEWKRSRRMRWDSLVSCPFPCYVILPSHLLSKRETSRSFSASYDAPFSLNELGRRRRVCVSKWFLFTLPHFHFSIWLLVFSSCLTPSLFHGLFFLPNTQPVHSFTTVHLLWMGHLRLPIGLDSILVTPSVITFSMDEAVKKFILPSLTLTSRESLRESIFFFLFFQTSLLLL